MEPPRVPRGLLEDRHYALAFQNAGEQHRRASNASRHFDATAAVAAAKAVSHDAAATTASNRWCRRHRHAATSAGAA